MGEQAAATKELETYWMGQPIQERWPLPVIAYLTGRISDQSLFAKARTADQKTTNDQTCEASFYVGSRRLIDGDQTGARQALEQAVQRCPHSFAEYHSAVAELGTMKTTKADRQQE
jgi:lipoprotein NlpI